MDDVCRVVIRFRIMYTLKSYTHNIYIKCYVRQCALPLSKQEPTIYILKQ